MKYFITIASPTLILLHLHSSYVISLEFCFTQVSYNKIDGYSHTWWPKNVWILGLNKHFYSPTNRCKLFVIAWTTFYLSNCLPNQNGKKILIFIFTLTFNEFQKYWPIFSHSHEMHKQLILFINSSMNYNTEFLLHPCAFNAFDNH